MELEKPDLYRLSDDGKRVRLLISRCGDCNGVMFPKALYGCRNCGAPLDRTREDELTGDASLISFVTVYQKLGPNLDPPFVVGEAEIAPGMVEEIMIDAEEDALEVGAPLVAVPKTVTRGDREVIACRFVPVSAV